MKITGLGRFSSDGTYKKSRTSYEKALSISSSSESEFGSRSSKNNSQSSLGSCISSKSLRNSDTPSFQDTQQFGENINDQPLSFFADQKNWGKRHSSSFIGFSNRIEDDLGSFVQSVMHPQTEVQKENQRPIVRKSAGAFNALQMDEADKMDQI